MTTLSLRVPKRKQTSTGLALYRTVESITSNTPRTKYKRAKQEITVVNAVENPLMRLSYRRNILMVTAIGIYHQIEVSVELRGSEAERKL